MSTYFQGTFVRRVQTSSKKSKPFRSLCSERVIVIHPSSKDEEISNKHGTRLGNQYLGVNSGYSYFYLVHYDT